MIISKEDNTDYSEAQILQKYKEVAMRLLPLSMPQVPPGALEEALDYSISKRIHNDKAKIENNYKEKTIEIDIVALCEYIIEKEPIICASGVMFKKHSVSANPLIDLVSTFLNNRAEMKNMMFSFPKGSAEFEKYNLFQLLAKIDANSLYGGLGNSSCLFYNINVATSITTQARACISSAGLQFEMFLANGCKFESLNEVVTFIDNVRQERGERKYSDYDLLDHNISTADCFAKIISTCGFNWIPTSDEADIILDILLELDPEDINRLYYKNNLYEFMENTSMTKAFIYIISHLNEPFLNPNEAPEEIQIEIDEFTSILMEYVYYHHHIIDRLDKYNHMVRNVDVLTDTDSVMVSVDAFYRWGLSKIQGMDFPILHDRIDIFNKLSYDEFGDVTNAKPIFERVDDDEYRDFDFMQDEVIEVERLLNPMKVVTQDGLRYSIINTIAYVLGEVIGDYMLRFTYGSNSFAEGKKCLIIMKNEFLFKRLYLTMVKKNYATIQEVQEGNVISGGYFDIKGLPLAKSSTNPSTQDRLQRIMYEDILNAEEHIDQIKLLKDLAIFEKDIISEIREGSTKYFKPMRLKAIDSYADPMSTPGVKALLAWNAVKDADAEGFNTDEENHFNVIKVNITRKNLLDMQMNYPETYAKFKELMEDNYFSTKINTLAIPKDIQTPEWILDYIDYDTILSDNLGLFPLEPIGIYKNNDANNYTNIISI